MIHNQLKDQRKGRGNYMDLCLSQIKDHLEECGVETEYKPERVKPYLNIGDVKHVKKGFSFGVQIMVMA